MGLIFNGFCVNDLDFEDRSRLIISPNGSCMRNCRLDIISKTRSCKLRISRGDFEKEVTCILSGDSFSVEIFEREGFYWTAKRLGDIWRIEATIISFDCTSLTASVVINSVSNITVSCTVGIWINAVLTYVNTCVSKCRRLKTRIAIALCAWYLFKIQSGITFGTCNKCRVYLSIQTSSKWGADIVISNIIRERCLITFTPEQICLYRKISLST